MKRICVFCGSNAGNRPSYAAAARDLAQELARRHLSLVYGGGHAGLMGILADAAIANGVEVIGVITEQLRILERGHSGLTESRTVATMHDQEGDDGQPVRWLHRVAGRVRDVRGTVRNDHLDAARDSRQAYGRGEHRGLFRSAADAIRPRGGRQLLRPENRLEVIAVATPAEALDAIATWTPPEGGKWFEPPRP